MIMVRTPGAQWLVRLLAIEGEPRPDLSWLLFGSTDPAVVAPSEKPEEPPFLLAAE